MYIKNKEEILLKDSNQLKKAGLSIINDALNAVNPYLAVKRLIGLKRNVLSIGSFHIDLSNKKNIYVLGGGKAVFPVAKALEEILGEKINEGLIIVKKGHQGILKKINIREASHPIPNQDGFNAAKEIKSIADKAEKKDLVFWINTGGISALAPLPVTSVTLNEKKVIHELLLSSGANIKEINAVRSHLSDIKGGKLALSIFPAEIINLIVSDNPGDPMNVGPTGLDNTTFSEAVSIKK